MDTSPYSITDFMTGKVIVKYREPITPEVIEAVHDFAKKCIHHFSGLRPTELRVLSQALGFLAEFSEETEPA